MGRREAYVQKKILDYLNSLPCTVAVKVSQGPFSHKGISDILCCHHGKFYAFEVKAKGGKPTVLQKYFLEQVKKALGEGHVVYSVDDVKSIMEGKTW